MQDVIFRIQVALNGHFDKVYKQKVQEIARVKERNKQVKELLDELEVEEELWVPVLNDREVPERVFVVKDSEVRSFHPVYRLINVSLLFVGKREIFP